MGMAKQIIEEIIEQANVDAAAIFDNAEQIHDAISVFAEYANIQDLLEDLYALDSTKREAMQETISVTEMWNERLEVGIFQQ